MIRREDVTMRFTFIGKSMRGVTIMQCAPDAGCEGLSIGIQADSVSPSAPIALALQGGTDFRSTVKLTPEQALTVAGELVKLAVSASHSAAEAAADAAGGAA